MSARYETAIGATDIENIYVIRVAAKAAAEEAEQEVLEATAELKMYTGKLLVEFLETEHQLRLAQLELIKANVLRELAESDAAGVKATLRIQQTALRDIAGFVTAGSTAGEQAVKNTLKGLGL